MRSDTGQMEGFKPPREDINSPDLYIPGKPDFHWHSIVQWLNYFLI